MKNARSSEPATYNTGTVDQPKPYQRHEIVAQALAVLEADARSPGAAFDSPQRAKDYIRIFNARHIDQHIERFSVLFLDSQNRMIECIEMFTGTLTQTSVYPREVVRAALRLNAAACILTHNHPSGTTQPSRADEHLTQTLKSSLSLVDVRVLDHMITAGADIRSMAEMGLV